VNSRRLDITQIRREWLRRLLADWVKETTLDDNDFRRTFEGCLSASRALSARSGGGHDPGTLKVTDMDAVVATLSDPDPGNALAVTACGAPVRPEPLLAQREETGSHGSPPDARAA
jgi:hypothetical protein